MTTSPLWKTVAGLALSASALLGCGGGVQSQPLPAPHQLPTEHPELWASPPEPQPDTLELPRVPVTSVTLSNGLQLSVAQRPESPVTAIEMWVPKAGGDPHGPVAAMVHALRTGSSMPDGTVLLNPRLSGKAISSWTERHGARFSWTVLSRASNTALQLLGAFVTRPSFDPAEVPGSLKQSLTWLQQYSWSGTYFQDLARNALPQFEFAQTDELARGILALTPDALSKLHRCRFSPEGAHLVVAGSVTPSEVQGWAEKAFSGWAAATETGCEAWQAPAPPKEEPLTRPELFLVNSSAPDPHFTLLLPAPPLDNPDHTPFVLAANAMAVSQDSIASELRHSGATYGIQAQVNAAYPDQALLELSGSVSPDSATQSLHDMVVAIREFSKTASDEDFEIAKRRLLTTMVTYASDARGVARQVIGQLRRGPVQDASAALRELLEVTPAQARAAAARWTDGVEPVILAFSSPRLQLSQGLRINAHSHVLRTKEAR